MTIGLPPLAVTTRPPARRIVTGPPPEAIAEVREVARAAERMRERGQEVRFERDPVTGRMRAELRDLSGRVLREIPLGEVLELTREVD